MSEALRRSLLSAASKDLLADDWDHQCWQRTESFLKSSFGVEEDIVGEQLRFLELYKSVETDEGAERGRDAEVFEKQWQEMIKMTSSRYGIRLESSFKGQEAKEEQSEEVIPQRRRQPGSYGGKTTKKV